MFTTGQRLGQYEIIDSIAAGGMGVVYRGRHAALGKDVAIKVLLPNMAMNPRLRARFQQEALLQANLQHPGIVQVLDVIQGERPAIVMELVEGYSLERLLNHMDSPPGEDWALSVMRPVVEAIAHAHTRSVVHRDLKPGNILIDARRDPPQARVTDFGIAKILDSGAEMTGTGVRMGTVPYMAPEQFGGLRDLDARADVFALGMLFWRILTGALPVDRDKMIDVMSFYTSQTALPRINEVCEGISEPLANALSRALTIERDARFAHAGELLDALPKAPELTRELYQRPLGDDLPDLTSAPTSLGERLQKMASDPSGQGIGTPLPLGETADGESVTKAEMRLAMLPFGDTVEAPAPARVEKTPKPIAPKVQPKSQFKRAATLIAGTVMVAMLGIAVGIGVDINAPEPTEPIVTEPAREDLALAARYNAEGHRARRANDTQGALVAYRLAVEAAPSDPWSRFNLARELALMGDRSEAMSHLRVLSGIDSPGARNALLQAAADTDLRSLWRERAFKSIIAKAGRQVPFDAELLRQPGCLGSSGETGEVACAWHCAVDGERPLRGVIFYNAQSQDHQNLTILDRHGFETPEDANQAWDAFEDLLQTRGMPAVPMPSWSVVPGQTTPLVDGYAVQWLHRQKLVRIIGPRGTTNIPLERAAWLGCPSGRSKLPVRLRASLSPELDVVALFAEFEDRQRSVEAMMHKGSWSAVRFVRPGQGAAMRRSPGALPRGGSQN